MNSTLKENTERIPALDELRGLAILLVLFSHLSERFTFNNSVLAFLKKCLFVGWTGVDLFFVLSGFLITGILYNSKNKQNYFKFFFARRAIRIFPLYYLTLIIMFLVPSIPLFLKVADHFPSHVQNTVSSQINSLSETRHYAIWYFTYLLNFLIAFKGYLFPSHFWSLAVEEHFYLIWPFIVYFTKKQSLVIVTFCIVISTVLIRLFVILKYHNPVAVYVLTPCRLDGLALGSMLSILYRETSRRLLLYKVSRITLLATGLAWIFMIYRYRGLSEFYPQYTVLVQTIGYLNTALFYSSLLIISLRVFSVYQIKNLTVFRFLGKYSYSIYIFHIFPIFLLAPLFALGNMSHYSILARFFNNFASVLYNRLFIFIDGAAYIILAVGLTILMSLISWNVVESPFLKLKRHFNYPKM